MLGYLFIVPPSFTIILPVKSCYLYFTYKSPMLKEIITKGHITSKWNSQTKLRKTKPLSFYSTTLMLILIRWICWVAVRNRKCTNLCALARAFKNWTSQKIGFTRSSETRASIQALGHCGPRIAQGLAAFPSPAPNNTWEQWQHIGSRPWSISCVCMAGAGRRDILAMHLSCLGLTQDPRLLDCLRSGSNLRSRLVKYRSRSMSSVCSGWKCIWHSWAWLSDLRSSQDPGANLWTLHCLPR